MVSLASFGSKYGSLYVTLVVKSIVRATTPERAVVTLSSKNAVKLMVRVVGVIVDNTSMVSIFVSSEYATYEGRGLPSV